MKAIIAEAESSKVTDPKAPALPSRPTGLERISQREKRKMSWPAHVDTFERPDILPAESVRTTGSFWKTTPAPAISPMAFPTLSLPSPSPRITTPLGTPPSGATRGKHSDPNATITPPVTPKLPGTPPRPPPLQSGLGPIFVPSRQSPAKAGPSSSRHASCVVEISLYLSH